DVRRVHHAGDRARFRVEEVENRKVIGKSARQIAVEHVDDLDADLHPGLPCRHRERKPFAGNRDLRARRALHLAAGECSERPFECVKQLRWIEMLRHFRLAQADYLLRALLDFESSLRHTGDPQLTVACGARPQSSTSYGCNRPLPYYVP